VLPVLFRHRLRPERATRAHGAPGIGMEVARWVESDDEAELKRFITAQKTNVAEDRDGAGHLSSAEVSPSSWRAMTRSWICWVPSKMSRIFESRAHFSSSSPSE
jgi:hypothetical protein